MDELTETIDLTLAVDELGRPFLVDQHGRRLAGVRNMRFAAGVNEPVYVTADIVCIRGGQTISMSPCAYRRRSIMGLDGETSIDITTVNDIPESEVPE